VEARSPLAVLWLEFDRCIFFVFLLIGEDMYSFLAVVSMFLPMIMLTVFGSVVRKVLSGLYLRILFLLNTCKEQFIFNINIKRNFPWKKK
jgi:hypothetical protein